MGFLIKSAFWFSLVLLLIPFGGQDADGQDSVGPVETFFAAKAILDDFTGLCERRPDACEFGKSALHTISQRAKESARIAYGLLDEHFSEPEEENPIHTGSISPSAEPAG